MGTRSDVRPPSGSTLTLAALLATLGATAPAPVRATTLLSVDLTGAAAGGGGLNRNPASRADISPDGRFVVFTSTATDLVAGINDTNGAADLFLRDRQAGTTAILSVDASGQALRATALGGLVFSPDSTRLAFRTQAPNMVAGLADANNQPDWFVRDLLTGATSCVTANAAGTATGNSTSFTQEPPVFSPDGTRLAFVSLAGDLVAGVADGGGRDVFLRNLAAGTTSLVSVRLDGAASGNATDDPPRFSPDGEHLAFLDVSANLVAGVADTNNFTDLFVRDLQAGSTRLVTRGAANQAVSIVSPYEWTPDGQGIVFSTAANNVVAGVADVNTGIDVFAWDLGTGSIRMLSVTPAGTAAGNKPSRLIGVSPDSRFVAFGSAGTDLTPASAGGDVRDDLYVRDLQTDSTAYVARNESSSVRFGLAQFSPDRVHLLFETHATDVVPGVADTNGDSDLFTYDLFTGAKTAVTVNVAGTATAASGLTSHDDTALNPDGRYVSFVSDAQDLVPGFASASTRDLFVRDLVQGVTSLVSAAPGGGGAGYDQGATRDAEFSPDGKFLVFTDNGLLAPITDPITFFGATNLYAFDLGSHALHLLSANAAGTGPGNGGVESFSFMAVPSGGEVLFLSSSSDMVAGVIDTPGSPTAFIPDLSDAFIAALPTPGATTTTTTLVGGTSTTTTRPTTPGSTTTTLPCATPRCLLEAARTSPSCAGEAIPRAVTKQLDLAIRLIEDAASGPAKRTSKLLRRARTALKGAGTKATRAARGKRPKLSGSCAEAIKGAASSVAGGLGR